MANVQEFTSDQLKQYIPGQNSFTWKDALFSGTAHANNLDSTQYSPEQTAYDSIIVTFEKIVTPLNAIYPGQVHINSCYRSHATEILVSGKDYGQHRKGEAVDISSVGSATNRDFFNWIYNNVEFDQIIWENGSAPGTGSPGPIISGNPRWVHISFNNTPGAKQRKMVLQTQDGKTYRGIPGIAAPNNSISPTVNDGDKSDTIPNPKKNTSESLGGNQSFDKNDPGTEGPNFQKTFEQIARNIGNLEAGDVASTWGKRLNPSEDSDWIGLKQFLLYLSSKFTPQSLLPFVELIPCITVDQPISADSTNEELSKNGYVKEGSTPKDVEDNLTSRSSDTVEGNKIKNKLRDQLKFLSEVPPGYNKDRFQTGANASNAASQKADLFSLDPFKEGLNYLGEESESGKVIRGQRNVGVRVYGQLVLNPSAIEGTPSKPGAIGFKSLEIQAGSSADNGLAMIKMQLVDVQGNKFTDLNSPWSFIYDTRPGSIGGDFFFRYGWQIRVPDPRDNADAISAKFWNHPGWEIFDDGSTNGVKHQIMEQIIPGKQVITLTQAINTGHVIEKDNSPLALFDEGVSFDEQDGIITTSRAILAAPDNNYVRLALLNPEIDMDEAGAITATLSFRTTGSVVFTLPLDYAITTRKLITTPSPRNKILLGDLLLALQNDADNFGFIAIQDKATRLKQSSFAQKDLRQKAKDRNFDGYVLIQGPDAGGNTGDIHPDEILINIDQKHMSMLSTSQKDSGVTLIRWFREVLQDNDCELLSAATGSGAGINSAWIITTTREFNNRIKVTKQQQVKEDSISKQTIEVFKTEKDVFSYRFQGSLVQSMKVEKTEAPNAMKIQTDFAVGDLASDDASAANIQDLASKPVTANDRKRNLKVIFSQMQNVTIESLCHPWIGPGKRIFVKGMGFFDGEYQVLEVTHKLEGHKFTSSILGARILLKSEEVEDKKDSKAHAAMNGETNIATPVTSQVDSTNSGIVSTSPPTSTQTATQGTSSTISSSPSSVNTSVEQVTSINPIKDNRTLTKLSGQKCNERLGALQNLRSDPDFLTTFTKTPSGADMTCANAFWCEQRKGNGVDYNWLSEGQRRNVQIIIDKTISALSDGMIDYTTAADIGKNVNAQFIVPINGTSTTIGS